MYCFRVGLNTVIRQIRLKPIVNETSPFKENVTLVALPDAEACKQRCYTLHEDMDQIVLYQVKKEKIQITTES